MGKHRPAAARKVSRGAECPGRKQPRPPIVLPYHISDRMPSHPRARSKPTSQKKGLTFTQTRGTLLNALFV